MDLLTSRQPIEEFLDSGADRPTLGLVYGRRRIGKSTLLSEVARERGGFYWEATRGETAVHLARLGQALGAWHGTGSLALDDWSQALERLLALGRDGSVPVVLDEFGYLLEADRTLDSLVAHALGPASRSAATPGPATPAGGMREAGRARLILCGSALAMMRSLTTGEVPLRGRAGLELVMRPLDFRGARDTYLRSRDPDLALRVFSVIGGVIGYASDMVDHDLPAGPDDFHRWVARRILSPAATLHHEATTLLAEDPTLSAASPALHHSILGAIANGSVTAGSIANRLRRSVSNLAPALARLVAAGFVLRHEDPIRSQRPLYALADPFLQFHYAILEPHAGLLRDRDARQSWEATLARTFDSRVRGPVFEEVARTWARRFADPGTLGGPPGFIGPSSAFIDGREHQLDVVVAAGGGAETPSERQVLAIGEAKAGQVVGPDRLRHLERARAALGPRAAHGRLLLIAPRFTDELRAVTRARADVDLVDLERLYEGE
ncbi:MAG TPA: hypothetical protein VGA70_11145 [Longimicrobiales bacterium]|jgi:hypothetical protein